MRMLTTTTAILMAMFSLCATGESISEEDKTTLEEGKLAALRDIGPIYVDVQIQSDESASYIGLTEEEVAATVELKMRSQDIPISKTHYTTDFHWRTLDIHLNLLPLKEVGRLVYSIDVSLKHSVYRSDAKSVASENRFIADTWERSTIGFVKQDIAARTLKDAVDAIVTIFLNDYLKANPKKE